MKRAKKNARFARERQLHYRLMRGIYRLCRSEEWTLRYARLHGNARACVTSGLVSDTGVPLATSVGTVDLANNVITIDFRSDVIATFIHECLHVLLEEHFGRDEHDAEECEVQRLEKLMLKHLSPIQAQRLHMHMVELLRGARNDPNTI